MARYELSHGSGTANAGISWGKHCSSFIQQQVDIGPTNWGTKVVHTVISCLSIIVLSLQYSSRYTPWMELQNLKDSLSINKLLLFITYFWPNYLTIGVHFHWPLLWMESNCRRWIPFSKADYMYENFDVSAMLAGTMDCEKTRQIWGILIAPTGLAMFLK